VARVALAGILYFLLSLENTLRPRCKICEADDDMSARIMKVREREGEGG
jgi:hypothetical protein